jgi:hypothetical protein
MEEKVSVNRKKGQTMAESNSKYPDDPEQTGWIARAKAGDRINNLFTTSAITCSKTPKRPKTLPRKFSCGLIQNWTLMMTSDSSPPGCFPSPHTTAWIAGKDAVFNWFRGMI